jgi:hypothetical protein
MTRGEYIVLRYSPGNLLGTYGSDSDVHALIERGLLQRCYEGITGVVFRMPTIRLTEAGIEAIIKYETSGGHFGAL